VSGKDDEHLSTEAPGPGTQRLDKWLWFARIAKSRTLATQLVQEGRVRVNRAKAAKPSQAVRRGDVLTIVVPRGTIEIVKVLSPGVRRGPPVQARLLYEVLTSMGAGASERQGAGLRAPDGGGGRPANGKNRSPHRK
jgi:ribosome-associated heat shock protein Hsp15